MLNHNLHFSPPDYCFISTMDAGTSEPLSSNVPEKKSLRTGLRNVWNKVKLKLAGEKVPSKTPAQYQEDYRKRQKATPELDLAFKLKQRHYRAISLARKTDEEREAARKKYNEQRREKR